MMKDRIWTLVSRKLSGEATASELAELGDLINTQANADLYLQAIDEFWKTPAEHDEEFLEATYHLHLNRLREKGFELENDDPEETEPLYFNYHHKPSRISQKSLVGIACAICIVGALFAFHQFVTRAQPANAPEKIAQSEVSTKSGSRTNIQLPDGSSVWLNGGSKLVYDNRHFGDKTREVTLTGEGYFDVVKNKEKPFILHANKLDIRVVGTAFNVRAYPEEKNTETSLLRGSIEVAVQHRNGKIIMKPNDKLVVSNDDASIPGTHTPSAARNSPKTPVVSMRHVTLVSLDNSVLETAWVENKLAFDKETFENVALKMERWYGVNIHFLDERLKLQRLTGTFEKETITEALNALQLSTPFFKYRINNQEIDITKN